MNFFAALDVEVCALHLDIRYGGLLAVYGNDALPADTMPGIEFVQDAQGGTRCISDHEAMGLLGAGGRLTIEMGLNGGPTRLSGRALLSGQVLVPDLNDLDGLEPRDTVATRRHLARLNSALPVKHAVLRKHEDSGWVAVIDPDTNYLRTLASDPGADYSDLTEQGEILAAIGAIMRNSNKAETEAYPNSGCRIAYFTFFDQPLAPENGLTGQGGMQWSQIKQLLPFTPIGAETSHRVFRPLHRVEEA
ncbi:hypothetical protein [Mesorhizobium metallidurans]|uniref:hypothetical protein n=1 Tax=Mesorhizobium metallidurans TaxID=489722 RepID=UPI0012F913A2|nr:hypothetical protein [Mesorhizobium metallidurans]